MDRIAALAIQDIRLMPLIPLSKFYPPKNLKRMSHGKPPSFPDALPIVQMAARMVYAPGPVCVFAILDSSKIVR